MKNQTITSSSKDNNLPEVETSNQSTGEEVALPHIKESWQWVTKVLDEAHLPHIGLPVKWYKSTESEHTKIAYDPDKKQAYNLTKGKVTQVNLDFITSTSGKNVMPGTKAPAAPRLERFNEDELQQNLVKDEESNVLVPCLVHGDYVKVESLQTDHLQAKEQILKRQKELIDLLNEKPEFAEFVMSLEGMDKFFVKTVFPKKQKAKTSEKQNKTDETQTNKGKEKYYGTLFFYELYFNDIDNLWLICQACNLHKGKQDTVKWLSKQWMYGRDFIKYLNSKLQENDEKGIEERQTILKKLATGEGLATVAIKWFWKNHSTFISNAKEFFEDLQLPFKILNKQVDVEFRQGKIQKEEIFQASLQTREQLASTVLNMPNLDMPASDNTTVTGKEPLIVTDQRGHNMPYNIEQYKDAINQVIEEAPNVLREVATEKLAEKINNIRSEHPTTSEEQNEPEEKRVKINPNNTPRSS